MTRQERETLREAAILVLSDRWTLQTSNSFRRIGTPRGDGDVLCGTKHWRDGHPDLLAAPAVLDYIVTTQPCVVLALLDDLDAAEAKQQKTCVFAEKLLASVKKLVDGIGDLDALNEGEMSEARGVVERLEVELKEMAR